MTSFLDTIKDITAKASLTKEEQEEQQKKHEANKAERLTIFKKENFANITKKYHEVAMRSIKRSAEDGKKERYINFITADFESDFSNPLYMLKEWLKEMSDKDSIYVPSNEDAVKLHFDGFKTSAFNNKKDGLTVQFKW